MAKKREEGTLNTGVCRAVNIAGGQGGLARALGVSQPSVYHWLYFNCPPERAIQIERVTGVKREEIRPDIFDSEE